MPRGPWPVPADCTKFQKMLFAITRDHAHLCYTCAVVHQVDGGPGCGQLAAGHSDLINRATIAHPVAGPWQPRTSCWHNLSVLVCAAGDDGVLVLHGYVLHGESSKHLAVSRNRANNTYNQLLSIGKTYTPSSRQH